MRPSKFRSLRRCGDVKMMSALHCRLCSTQKSIEITVNSRAYDSDGEAVQMSICKLCRCHLRMAPGIAPIRPSVRRPFGRSPPFKRLSPPAAAAPTRPTMQASERGRDKHHHPSKIHPSIRPLLLYLSKKEQRTAAKSHEIPGPRSPTSAAPVGRPL